MPKTIDTSIAALKYIHAVARKILAKRGKGITSIPNKMEAEAKAGEIAAIFQEAGIPSYRLDHFIKNEKDVTNYLNMIEEAAKPKVKKSIPSKPADVIDFPPDRVTDWTKARPGRADIPEIPKPTNVKTLNTVPEKPGMAGYEYAIKNPAKETVSPERVAQGFSTRMKLNNAETNKLLAQDLIQGKSAEFNNLTMEAKSDIINKINIQIKKVTPDEPQKFYQGGQAQAQIEPDLSGIGHGSDALMARNMLIAPGSQATTSTGLNYLLGEDNDTTRVPYKEGEMVLPKAKPESAKTKELLKKVMSQAGANTLTAETRQMLIEELKEKLRNENSQADGGRTGYKIGDIVKAQGSGSISGKQQIQGAPKGITSNKSFISLIIDADIPLTEKFSILGEVNYNKFRDRIEKDGEELFLEDPASYVDRKVGIGFNQGNEGFSGSAKYGIDSGEPEYSVNWKKSFAGGGVAGLLGESPSSMDQEPRNFNGGRIGLAEGDTPSQAWMRDNFYKSGYDDSGVITLDNYLNGGQGWRDYMDHGPGKAKGGRIGYKEAGAVDKIGGMVNYKNVPHYLAKPLKGVTNIAEWVGRLPFAATELASDMIKKPLFKTPKDYERKLNYQGIVDDMEVPGVVDGGAKFVGGEMFEKFGDNMEVGGLSEKLGITALAENTGKNLTDEARTIGDLAELGGEFANLGGIFAAGKNLFKGADSLKKLSQSMGKVKENKTLEKLVDETLTARGEGRRDFNKLVASGGLMVALKSIGLGSLTKKTNDIGIKMNKHIVDEDVDYGVSGLMNFDFVGKTQAGKEFIKKFFKGKKKISQLDPEDAVKLVKEAKKLKLLSGVDDLLEEGNALVKNSEPTFDYYKDWPKVFGSADKRFKRFKDKYRKQTTRENIEEFAYDDGIYYRNDDWVVAKDAPGNATIRSKEINSPIKKFIELIEPTK